MGVNNAIFSSAGQVSQHVIPGAYSRRNYIPNEGGGVSVGNVCILGDCRAGEPQKLLIFSSANDARSELESGPLLEGVIQAFDPGNDLVPQQIGCMRVNPGTQSARTLQKTSTDIITLKSFSYGVPMNQVKVKFSAGTIADTRKIETEYKGNDYIADNIGRQSLSIQYIGAGTASVLTIDNTSLIVATTGGAAEDSFTITLADFPTISELSQFINDKAGFTSAVLTPEPTQLSTKLDAVTTIDIQTAVVTVRSDLEAVLEAFGVAEFIGEVTYVGTSRVLPDNDSDFVYLSGAVDGAYTVTEWNDALEELEKEDIQLVSSSSTDSAVHGLIKNHCVKMSSVEGKSERQFYVGGALNEDVSAVALRAFNLNSYYGSLCSPGYYQFDDNGDRVLYNAAMYACKQVGMLNALNLNNPTTWKTVNVLGWENDYSKPDIEQLIRSGVLVGGKKPDGQYITIRSVTTYQGSLLQKNEASMVRESLYMSRDLRTTIENALIGTPLLGNDSLASVDSIFFRKINEWNDLGVIVKGDDQPALYWGYTRQIVGDVIKIEYNTYDTAPTNFVFITSNHNVLVTS